MQQKNDSNIIFIPDLVKNVKSIIFTLNDGSSTNKKKIYIDRIRDHFIFLLDNNDGPSSSTTRPTNKLLETRRHSFLMISLE